jgi:apolipoprotein N-acyltransferase
MMREIKKQGADVMLNLTSDAWFPTSRLMQQHFDHARPRTVENGIPLLRACNTGITGAIDSLGRVVAVLGENPKEAEWIADSLKIEVPTYSFNTLYSLVGDYLILVISLGAICFALFFKDS